LSLEVWDRGPGIPEDKRQVIFEEYKRLDGHQTHAAKGLGLSLAIADGLCRILEHPLQVRSWTGKGSVFSVQVPLASAQTPMPAKLVEINRPALNGTQVLCVDNED
ncbi:sensor histidine kinase, partial [Pseudomonas viridiflava]|uniref:sensor histidine kinase n=1 Tax=Pseudomonas viridiflava TaxID=33069 RepID=UPI0013C3171E